MARFMFVTRQYIDMSIQEELDYNNWYWVEHIPAMTSVAGVINGKRYKLLGDLHPDAPQYMAIYEIENEQVIESDDWWRNAKASEWGKRVNMHFNGNPGAYMQIFPNEGDTASYPASDYLYVTRMTPRPEGEVEFNNWYNEYHIPEMTAVPGVLTGKRFMAVGKAHKYAPKYLAIYELESPKVPESQEWKEAGYTKRSRDVLDRTRILKSVPGVYGRIYPPKSGK